MPHLHTQLCVRYSKGASLLYYSSSPADVAIARCRASKGSEATAQRSPRRKGSSPPTHSVQPNSPETARCCPQLPRLRFMAQCHANGFRRWSTARQNHMRRFPRGSHSQKAEFRRDRSVPAMARSRNRRRAPQVTICMGATAAQSLLGRDFRVTQHRGEFLESTLAPSVTATIHPSAILRAPDEETWRIEFAKFVADLKNATKRR